MQSSLRKNGELTLIEFLKVCKAALQVAPKIIVLGDLREPLAQFLGRYYWFKLYFAFLARALIGLFTIGTRLRFVPEFEQVLAPSKWSIRHLESISLGLT